MAEALATGVDKITGGAELQQRAEAIIRASVGPSTSVDGDLFEMTRENMLVEIARQYLKGVPSVEIAKQLGVDAQFVWNELAVLRKRWRDAALADFTEKRAQELAKLDELEAVYWRAWDLSQQHAIEQIRTDGFDQQGNKRAARHVTKQKSQTGDVRFLDGVWKCIERRAKLLGLDADQKHVVAATITTETTRNDLHQRMERYAGVFGFVLHERETDEPADDDGAGESVDSARSPSATGGLPDVVDAEWRDGS